MADATDRNMAEKTRKTSDALGMTGMFGSEILRSLRFDFPISPFSVICNFPFIFDRGQGGREGIATFINRKDISRSTYSYS